MAVSGIVNIVVLVLLSEASAFQIQPALKTFLGAVPYQYPPQEEYYPPRKYVEQSYLPPAIPSPPPSSTLQVTATPPAENQAPEEHQSTPKYNSTILEALNSNLKNGTAGKFDSGVLNNLAIALQLLIVSNLLNSSPEIAKHANSTLALAKKIQSYRPPCPYDSPPNSVAHYPNANFLGSSSISDPGVMSIYSGPYVSGASPHVPRHLKSPYEAIATPISPFDRYVSDFHSPYQAILSHGDYGTDLFSF